MQPTFNKGFSPEFQGWPTNIFNPNEQATPTTIEHMIQFMAGMENYIDNIHPRSQQRWARKNSKEIARQMERDITKLKKCLR